MNDDGQGALNGKVALVAGATRGAGRGIAVFLALGWSALWISLATLVATATLFVFFDAKSRREERWLQEKFDGYGRYKTRVRKLVPFIY